MVRHSYVYLHHFLVFLGLFIRHLHAAWPQRPQSKLKYGLASRDNYKHVFAPFLAHSLDFHGKNIEILKETLLRILMCVNQLFFKQFMVAPFVKICLFRTIWLSVYKYRFSVTLMTLKWSLIQKEKRRGRRWSVENDSIDSIYNFYVLCARYLTKILIQRVCKRNLVSNPLYL